ncbi:MAG: asparaginase [Planctomycetota bacterium]
MIHGRAIHTHILRGGRLESAHRATAVICPCGGDPILIGEDDPGTHLRSVAKPFQTLTLLAAGVAERFSLSDEEVAVITASHAGESLHQRLVAGLIGRDGLTPEDLRCGIHPPFSRGERHRRLAAGEPSTVLDNNCSGKHAGMLLHCRHLGVDPTGYLEADHPVQRPVRAMLERFTGMVIGQDRIAVDGCGAPTFHLPLVAIARAFSRLLDERTLAAAGLLAASRRLHHAIAGHPRAFSGEGRIPYLWSEVLAPGIFSKEGAEGLHALWGEAGAIIIKSHDGQERGYRHAVPGLLERAGWLSGEALERWQRIDPPILRNVAGRVVGRIEVTLP